MDFSTEKGSQKFIMGIIGVAGTIAVAVFGLSPDKSDALISVLTIFAPMVGTALYYLVNQIAASGKAKTEIKKEELAISAAEKGINIVPPKAEEAAAVPVAVPVVTEPPATFDEDAFMAEVNKTVAARYLGNVNPSTVFYNAEQVYRDWSFESDAGVKEAREVLVKLADAAFKAIWGASYVDAWKYLNDPLGRGNPLDTSSVGRGCTYPDLKFKARQMGMGYYTALLDYERVAQI